MTNKFIALLAATVLAGSAIAAPPLLGILVGKAPGQVLTEIPEARVSTQEQLQPVSPAFLPLNPVDQSEAVMTGLNARLDIQMLQDFSSDTKSTS